MFERYTERARRVIFYARYEASQYGSPYIETEHLLLGLLREDFHTVDLLIPGAISVDRIRTTIESKIALRECISTSIEVPLAQPCKRILNLAGEEADKLGHRHIGTEHLLLALLRVEEGLAFQILSGYKPELARIEERVRKMPKQTSPGLATVVSGGRIFPTSITKFEGPQEFFESLREGNWQELTGLFSERSFFVDVKGKLWSGRKEISENLQPLLAPFATKNARHHLEAELHHNPAVWMGTILWEHVLLEAHPEPAIVRMTLTYVLENGMWRISSLQITSVAEPEAKEKSVAR